MYNASVNTPSRYKVNTTAFHHYWKRGAGVELLNKLNYIPDLADADKLKPYLFQFDKEGDEAIIELCSNKGFINAMDILKQYTHGETVPDHYKKLLDAFFDKINTWPAWVDFNKIEKGAELSRRTGIPGLLVLRNYCLMGGYESAAINKPLIYTGALKKGAAKRLGDTTLFWVGITREKAFEKGGEGLYHVISTRLIHSFSRINILQRTDWKIDQWGIPLNTWDMLATQLGFSLVFLTGLRRMGFKPTYEEVDGLFHMWKYIGHLLGIPLQLLPDNEEEAIKALYLWTMTQSGADDDSLALAKALVIETLESGFPESAIMRRFMQQMHLFYNHYFLGAYSCRLLQIPKPGFGNIGHLFLWRLRQIEKRMKDPDFRKKAILKNGSMQAHAMEVYLKFRAKKDGNH